MVGIHIVMIGVFKSMDALTTVNLCNCLQKLSIGLGCITTLGGIFFVMRNRSIDSFFANVTKYVSVIWDRIKGGMCFRGSMNYFVSVERLGLLVCLCLITLLYILHWSNSNRLSVLEGVVGDIFYKVYE